eukprot:TRINITY_DN16274_c0_g1_i19.p2 TRINITY_DN16274_c0_g1~~TRINITY_DN16274_c0_g1_i19.p2  ORF type:complete len:396 (-),score=83.03 TRINITY_DN16274_c0_g1_i19:1039-2226(-)
MGSPTCLRPSSPTNVVGADPRLRPRPALLNTRGRPILEEFAFLTSRFFRSKLMFATPTLCLVRFVIMFLLRLNFFTNTPNSTLFSLTLDARNVALCSPVATNTASTMTSALSVAKAFASVVRTLSSIVPVTPSVLASPRSMMASASAAGLQLKRSGDATPAGGAPKLAKKLQETKKEKNAAAAASGKHNHSDLLLQVAKLAIHTSRDVAGLKAVLIETTLFTKDSELGALLIKTSKDVTASFRETSRSLNSTERAALGSPHLYVWLELVAAAAQWCKDKNFQQEQAIFVEHQQELETRAKEIIKDNPGTSEPMAVRLAAWHYTKIMRISKCWNPNMSKMEIQTDNSTAARKAAQVLARLLVTHAQGVRKQGQAPKNDQERRIIAHLEKVSMDTDV